MAPLLEINELRTCFDTEGGRLHAVDGVSLSVEKGKMLGLVGESGCGKSVTALSVMRLIPEPPGKILSGEILWKGEDILKMPSRDLPDLRGREIAMIFQDPMASLNPVFTIEKQLGEVLKKRFGLVGAPAREKAADMLDQVGLSDPEQRLASYPHELSGGMKQRIMIAMMLMCEPELLIADEPTTALDVTIQAQILALIKDMQSRTGMGIILITHDMGVVAQTCDEVAVMYAGRIVERCSVQEMFTSARHPYAHALLESIPKRGLSKDKPLPTIEGTVPNLMNPPTGCRFAERCELREAKCDKTDPQLETLSPDHSVACHFPMEPAR